MSTYVFVLECEEDYILIGDVRKLDTESYTPVRFRGLYNVEANYAYQRIREFDHSPIDTKYYKDNWLEHGNIDRVQLQIANRYWYERKGNTQYGSGNEWYKVLPDIKKRRAFLKSACASYKWASEGLDRHTFSSNPATSLTLQQVFDRPSCDHGYPCEIRQAKDHSLYFDCPLKFIWPSLLPDVDHGVPCQFHCVSNY